MYTIRDQFVISFGLYLLRETSYHKSYPKSESSPKLLECYQIQRNSEQVFIDYVMH